MKKLFSILLALTMLLCTACGGETGGDDTATESAKNIYTEITGVPADKTLMTVGEVEIPAEMLFYWINAVARDAELTYQQYAMYYSQYRVLLNSNGTLNWKASYSDTMTIGDAITAQAMERLAYFVIAENMAKANGIALTEENYAEINATIEENLDLYAENLVSENSENASLTREEIEEKYFYTLGVSREFVVRLMGITYLNDALLEQMLTEGTALYVEDAAYEDMAFYADHILIAKIDLASGAALSDEMVAKKKALAEELLTRLQASDDMETLFASLADEYSEDTGRTAYPTGYIFTPGTMVTAFEDGVKALQPGELSGIVESEYGYHIILRRDLAEGLRDYPDEKAALAENYLTTLINSILLNSTVSTDEVLGELDLGEVYTKYMQMTGQHETADSGIEVADK